VDEEPARALRNLAADDQDGEPEDRAHREGDPPAHVGREQRGVEQEDRADRADRRPDPVAAVDREVDPAAVPRGDQLIDRRVDRRVLAADARSGEEAADEEVPGLVREGGGDGGG
jgi:hypothetical protein